MCVWNILMFLCRKISEFFNWCSFEIVLTPEAIAEKSHLRTQKKQIFVEFLFQKLSKWRRRCLLQKYLEELAHLSLINKTHTIGDHFKNKDKQTHLERCHVVYKLKCSFGHSYIGQTQRNLKLHLDEHNFLKSNHQATDVIKHSCTYPRRTFKITKSWHVLLTTANY